MPGEGPREMEIITSTLNAQVHSKSVDTFLIPSEIRLVVKSFSGYQLKRVQVRAPSCKADCTIPLLKEFSLRTSKIKVRTNTSFR